MGADVSEIYQMRIPTILGPTVGLDEYKGKVMLIVNTASGCGFAPQLKALQALHQKYFAEGLVVLGFPSNDFNQEPLSDGKLTAQICNRYGADFALLEVPHVKGPQKHPLFDTLTRAAGGWLGRDILWNFEKFLVGRDGKLINRWRSITSPAGRTIRGAIETALKSPPQSGV